MPTSEQPVGRIVDSTPSPRPGPVKLVGRYCRVVKLDPAAHGDALNAASMRAARRLGFTFEGIFRQHMIIKGRNRDTAWFAMLDTEWPGRKLAFERWLAPENFDAEGHQRLSLSALNAAEAEALRS